jgi:hypothetical protein
MKLFPRLFVYGLILPVCFVADIAAARARHHLNDIFIVEATPTTAGLKLLSYNQRALHSNQHYRVTVLDPSPEVPEIFKFSVNGDGAGGFVIDLAVGVNTENACDISISDDAHHNEAQIHSNCTNGLSLAVLAEKNNYHLVVSGTATE